MKAARESSRYVIGGLELTREEIVHKYLHLVKYVAGRISINLPPNVEINDLINDGILGLIDATEKYDDARGVKFETYAITRINGAILDALRALDWVPRAVRQRARELERMYQELEQSTAGPHRPTKWPSAWGSRVKNSTFSCRRSAERRCCRSRVFTQRKRVRDSAARHAQGYGHRRHQRGRSA